MEYRNLELREKAVPDCGPACMPSRRPSFSEPGFSSVAGAGDTGLWRGFFTVSKATFGLLLAFVLVTLIAGAQPVRADDMDNLKTAVSDAEKELSKADKAEREVLKKINDNNTAQKKAQGEELQRLKSEAVELKSEARTATNARVKAERSLATQRGELRKEASKVAEEQLSAQGTVNARAKRAGEAVETWSSAMGVLLSPPEVRRTEGLDDAEVNAQRQDDKQRLNDYISWASTEKSNVDTELKRAEALVNGEDKFKGADGHARLTSDCKQLKQSLDSRKTTIESSIKTAQQRLKSLEK